MSPLSMALTANTASVRKSSVSNNTTTLVGNGTTDNAGGDTTLAAGDHGDAKDSAQVVSDSIDAHPGDHTDSYEEAWQTAAYMDATMLAGQKTQVLCIALCESLSLSHAISLSMHADLTRGDLDPADFGKQTELDAYTYVAYSLLDTFTQ
jgi:hypothetical protein